MRLVTVNPHFQTINEDDYMVASTAEIEQEAINRLAGRSYDNTLFIWQLVEKVHVDTTVTSARYLVNEKGEVVPK